MRVLMLGPYPPPHGGVQTHVVALERFLTARGVHCQFINLTRHRKEETGRVFYPRTAVGVASLLSRLNFDIAHLHFGGDLTARNLGLGMVCSLLPGVKSVLTFHSGGYPSSVPGRASTPGSFQGVALRRFDLTIAVNQEIADFFRRVGVHANRIRVISPSAVFEDDIEAVQADGAGLLSEPMRRFIEAHRPTLVTVGLLEPEYDLGLQIDALGDVRERFPGAGLLIIGSGSLDESLRRRVESKRYSEHVMLCGDVPHRATLRAIVESDLLLRTTLYDGDAVSVREALRLGTRVIATDNRMRPAGVHLIPRHDRAALGDAVVAAVESPRAPKPHQPRDDCGLEAVWKAYKELLQ